MSGILSLAATSTLSLLVASSAGCTQRDAKSSSSRQATSASIAAPPHDSDRAGPSGSGTVESDSKSPESLAVAPSIGANGSEGVADAGSTDTGPATPRASTHSACRILAIGDSLTDPRSHGGGYLEPWTQHCPSCPVTNIARGGAMVNQMLAQLRRHLEGNPETYSHWVVFGGVNDLYSDQTAHRTLARIEHDLSTIYALGHAHKSTVVAIGVAPWGGFRRWFTEERGSNTAKLNQWMREQKSASAIDVFVDSGPPLTCGNPIELCPELAKPYHDGLHFGAGGHHKLGIALLDALGQNACE